MRFHFNSIYMNIYVKYRKIFVLCQDFNHGNIALFRGLKIDYLMSFFR